VPIFLRCAVGFHKVFSLSLETLKYLRLLVPGIIIVIFWGLLGKWTGDWKFDAPKSLSDLAKTLPAIIAGVIYYVTPLRDWANRRNHADVKLNIMNGITDIAGDDTDQQKSKWPNVKMLFYRIVDSDESLKIQSKRAYFNGLLWTSTADLKAISILFAVYSILHHFIFSSQGALIGVVVFSLIAAATWPISWKLTALHMEISDGQIDIIRKFHSDKVKAYFEND
jgi:hypothetical protein